MEQFINDISSLYWWLGVILVGIFVHLVGGFLEKRLESHSSKFRMWRINRNIQKKERFNEAVRKLIRDRSLIIEATLEEIQYRTRAIEYMLHGFLSFGIGSYCAYFDTAAGILRKINLIVGLFFLLVGILMFLMTVMLKNRADEIKYQIYETKRHLGE